MKILLACESSNVTSKAFRERGHLVTSCDILPNDEDQTNHYQGDVRDLLSESWDLIIAHPPCTRLCNSGVRWLAERNLWEDMREGAEFFKLFLNSAPKVCIENPIMHKHALEIIGVKHSQTIQPWEYGHTTSKRTCLWLEGLPPLMPTQIIPKEQRTNEIHMATPGKDRWKIRSKSFEGIAKAMAEQWSPLLTQNQ